MTLYNVAAACFLTPCDPTVHCAQSLNILIHKVIQLAISICGYLPKERYM